MSYLETKSIEFAKKNRDNFQYALLPIGDY